MNKQERVKKARLWGPRHVAGHEKSITTTTVQNIATRNLTETEAGGDLDGLLPNPSVVRLQGRAITDVAPLEGYGLIWNASAAEYTLVELPTQSEVDAIADDLSNHAAEIADVAGVGGTGTLGHVKVDGATIGITAEGVIYVTDAAGKVSIQQSGTLIGRRPIVNLIPGAGAIGITTADNSGSDRVDVTIDHGSHTGDATGSGALTVVALRGRTISTTAPSSGQYLSYDGSQWVPSTLFPLAKSLASASVILSIENTGNGGAIDGVTRGNGNAISGSTYNNGHAIYGYQGEAVVGTPAAGAAIACDGSFQFRRRTIAGNYTARVDDYLIAVTTLAAGLTVTLPAAALFTNRILHVKDETGLANGTTRIITVAGAGGALVDGAASKTITTGHGSLKVYSNGTNWFTL
jgi:hypothetical protein